MPRYISQADASSRGRTSRERSRRGLTRAIAAIVAAALAVMVVTAPAALAAGKSSSLSDPTAAEYDSTSSSAASGDGSGDGVSHQIGGLPFTGFDVMIMVAAAVALTGTGLVLRRLSRRDEAGLGSPRA